MSDAASPAPDASNNPPHFKVGLGFVKAYYRTLTEAPDTVAKFYKAGTSFLGHGEGSTVADPKPLEEYDLSVGRWGCSNNETMRFDFEHGAIDTQPVNGGVLLVVTAQVFFDKDGSSTKASECKDFVQTFFLVGEGRSFACYNDVLRFLDFPEGKKAGGKTSTATTTSAGTNTNTTTTADVGVETEPTEEKKTEKHVEVVRDLGEISTEATPALTDDLEAPGGGVEESKEEAPEEEPVPAPAPAKDGKGKRGGKNGKPQQQQQQQQDKQQPAAKPSPGSWASLVASGGSAPNTPSRKSATSSDQPPAEEPVDTTTAPAPATAEKPEAAKAPAPETIKPAATQEGAAPPAAPSNGATKPAKGQPFQRPKRDPDNTLVIKNLSDNIKESDIINMFKPFAMATNAKIVGTNLNHHRGLAFVDYDQVAPVLAALQKHKETPFTWNGKTLEVDQKSQEVKARRKDNNGGYRGGGGGRDSYNRRGDRGRGGRGSRGGGRGGGGGR